MMINWNTRIRVWILKLHRLRAKDAPISIFIVIKMVIFYLFIQYYALLKEISTR